MKFPACHEPLMVFLSDATVPVLSPISAHHGVFAPPLFPGDTAIARWNRGEPVVSGSASVLPLTFSVALMVAALTVFAMLMPLLLTWRMSFPVTAALNVPPVPGSSPIPAQPCAQPDPVTPVLPI